MEPIIIIPTEGQFKSTLDEGTSQLNTYDNKFDIYMDFQPFKRENVRIKVDQVGAINVRALRGLSRNEDSIVSYNANIFIPKHERAIRNSFVCEMNENGILRISGIYSPAAAVVDQDNLPLPNLIGETEEEYQKSIESSEDENESYAAKGNNPKRQRSIKKTGSRKTSETSLHDERQDQIYTVKPLDSDFECDVSLIQDKSEFRPTPDKTWRTFVNCSKYSPEDIKIEIINNGIVRISLKEERRRLYSGAFLREFRIPSLLGCRAEDIEAGFNENGILRLIADTDESKLFGKVTGIQRVNIPAPKLTIIKPILSGSVVRTKTEVSTPWGQRVATATKKTAQSATPTESNIEKFETSIAAEDYSPDELVINIRDGWLTITGKKKTSTLEGSTFQNKTFTEKIQIPETINPESIICGQDSSTGVIHISSTKL